MTTRTQEATQRRQKRVEQEASRMPPEAPASDPNEAQQEGPSGILVLKEITPDGRIQVNIQAVGSAQITEVPFLLEMGLKVFRQDVGFDERK